VDGRTRNNLYICVLVLGLWFGSFGSAVDKLRTRNNLNMRSLMGIYLVALLHLARQWMEREPRLVDD